ncbi:sulfite exporter TauE/SafE family protein [Streptomyces caniscabiei]|uniref:Probable membrane transporter protein n=1 Tax=Streptomyces caniscabiei TaxID=2746961 RepID=A0A927L3Y0_9ACTN|nr:sulfite exporter TauE/SafE family protein [Streptomyces caniscabiei]MBD9700782.1 sulfite exporter TauE/SafE family protein [Streptomyces caniscabiei]MBD9725062.1 sulfite exporter TauE/SafE family protein [Streptomyces caniscabiei]MDX3510366.1 sulfite exporter TauE/SafE family protein [Streptomyces caniscabiei]MDX3720450.1 sulfite exporter TauE/SafE family protein [Streptomyces caniscabiei]MDX3727672.1 sulfite exporter TauE/SafE family protein [Streptomyces caniscabiei]
MSEILLVWLAGLAAGTLNAVGGGGTFVALPALVAAGLPPVTANAASTIALLPGSVAGTWVSRHEITQVGGASTRAMTMTGLVGGGVGAALLLTLPSASFDAAVPWLLAFATLVLAFGRPALRLLGTGPERARGLGPGALLAGHFLLSVYGGYFGGAVGLLMLALWSIGLGLDPATGNPMRIAQVTAVYVSAAALFLVASDALTAPVLLSAMLTGAVAGGFAGARLALRLPASALRAVVLGTAVTMTALYFSRAGMT